jgi:hypothetical protein
LIVPWPATISNKSSLFQLVIDKAFEIQNSKPSPIASLGGKGISGFRYLRIQVGAHLKSYNVNDRSIFLSCFNSIVSG